MQTTSTFTVETFEPGRKCIDADGTHRLELDYDR